MQIEYITYLYKQLFQIPQSLAKIVSNYNWILLEDSKKFKKKQKSEETTMESVEEQLAAFKRQRKEIETLMFEDNLQLGPFIVEVGKLRVRLLKKLDELQ